MCVCVCVCVCADEVCADDLELRVVEIPPAVLGDVAEHTEIVAELLVNENLPQRTYRSTGGN